MSERRHPLILAVGLCLLGWVVGITAWGNAPYVLVFDDAYYYLEIAQRLAAGEGSTFDGRNPTNGYHPLWMLICLAWHPESMGAVRLMLLGQLGLVAVGVGWMAKTVIEADAAAPPDRERSVALALIFVSVLFGPLALKTSVNGLESALYLVGVAACWRLAWLREGALIAGTSWSERVMLSALFTLAFLSRTDAALWLLCVGLGSLPAAWRLRGPGLARLLELFLLPALAILVFMAVNQQVFGAPVQISGMVKRVDPSMVGALGLLTGVAVPTAAVAWAHRREGQLARWLRSSGGFAVGLGLMAGYYTTMQQEARPWYFGLHLLYGAVAACLGALDLLVRERRASVGAMRGMAALLVVPILLTALAQLAAVPIYTRLIALREGQQLLGERLAVHLATGERAGSWDAGLIGYRCAGDVTNLDGLVNSLDFLHRVRAGEGPEWVAEQDLRWFANHGIPEAAPCGQLIHQVGLIGGDALEKRLIIEDRWLSAGGDYEFCIVHAP